MIFLNTFLFKNLEANECICLSHSYFIFDELNKSVQLPANLPSTERYYAVNTLLCN